MTDQYPPQQWPQQQPEQASSGQFIPHQHAPAPQVPAQQPVPGGQGHATGTKPGFWKRTPVLIVSAIVLVGLGYGIGQPSASTANKELTTARSQLKTARSQLETARAQLAATRGNLTSTRLNLQQARTAARQADARAAAKYKADEAKLASKEKALTRTRHGLLALEGRIQASSINADGVYVVGADIKPGTWHTSGDGGSGNQCYYALLNSTNTSDIIDNNNFDGPETVDTSGAHALEINGPCTWVRTS